MSQQPQPDGGRTGAALNPPVFFGAAVLIALFVTLGAAFPERAGTVFSAVQAWIAGTLGWFYVLSVATFLIFAAALAFGSHARIRLGPDDSEPDFSYTSWFAMLFSAGMGIGLMFFAVAEPVMHFTTPPVGAGGDAEAARNAMAITFFHWGLHAWAIYAVIGLSLAYFSFRHGLPLAVRSALYPLIGARINGPVGHAVDLFAVLGTMFGVATSLGLGVLQINAGLSYLFGIEEGIGTQLILVGLITLLATASVAAGLDAGIRRLSEFNILLAVILLAFVLVTGPTVFLLEALVQNVGAYLSDLVERTFLLYAYEPNEWIASWTLFYWGWWIAWSPFVGMFIARVSRGRTIREFVVGVLFVPTGFTFMWMTVFGDAAISFEMAGLAPIAATVAENVPLALFQFLEVLPIPAVTSLVATVLVVTFFVTSSDSGSLVIGTITSGGREDPPLWQRVFWALAQGVVAAVLLVAGGLDALQTAAIASALPFAIVMLFICYGLARGLKMEATRRRAAGPPARMPVANAQVPWQRWLANILTHPRHDQVEAFLVTTAMPALEAVAEEFRRRGLRAEVESTARETALTVYHGTERDFVYALRLRGYAPPSFAFPDHRAGPDKTRRYWRAEVHLPESGQVYDVMGYTSEQLIGDVLSQYDRHVHFLLLAH